MIIADTSGLLGLFNRSEPSHDEIARIVAGSAETLVVSPYVVAELDYLIATRMGLAAELAVLAELAGGAYELAAFGPQDLASAASVIERSSDQEIGVTDASVVVLAERYRTRSLLTLDHRHFEVVRPIDGGRFQLLPAASFVARQRGPSARGDQDPRD